MILDITIMDETMRLKEKHRSLIHELIQTSAEELALDENIELSVTIVDNEKIQEINRTYRGIDQATDVISFALEDEDEEEFPVLFEEDFLIPLLLGDIFISIDQTIEQAATYGHSFERELGFLVVHGFLHLNGFDHQTSAQEKEMFALQEKILKEYGLER